MAKGIGSSMIILMITFALFLLALDIINYYTSLRRGYRNIRSFLDHCNLKNTKGKSLKCGEKRDIEHFKHGMFMRINLKQNVSCLKVGGTEEITCSKNIVDSIMTNNVVNVGQIKRQLSKKSLIYVQEYM